MLRLKYKRLLKFFLFGQSSRAKRKSDHLWLGWEDVVSKDLRKMGTSWETVKRKVLNKSECEMSVLSCVGLRRLDAAVSY